MWRIRLRRGARKLSVLSKKRIHLRFRSWLAIAVVLGGVYGVAYAWPRIRLALEEKRLSAQLSDLERLGFRMGLRVAPQRSESEEAGLLAMARYGSFSPAFQSHPILPSSPDAATSQLFRLEEPMVQIEKSIGTGEFSRDALRNATTAQIQALTVANQTVNFYMQVAALAGNRKAALRAGHTLERLLGNVPEGLDPGGMARLGRQRIFEAARSFVSDPKTFWALKASFDRLPALQGIREMVLLRLGVELAGFDPHEPVVVVPNQEDLLDRVRDALQPGSEYGETLFEVFTNSASIDRRTRYLESARPIVEEAKALTLVNSGIGIHEFDKLIENAAASAEPGAARKAFLSEQRAQLTVYMGASRDRMTQIQFWALSSKVKAGAFPARLDASQTWAIDPIAARPFQYAREPGGIRVTGAPMPSLDSQDSGLAGLTTARRGAAAPEVTLNDP